MKTGIGADGVIVLSPDTLTDFRFRIFNADGSEPRCAATAPAPPCLHTAGYRRKGPAFSTMAGIVEARVHNDGAAVQMTVPFGLDTGSSFPSTGPKGPCTSSTPGVPHTIVFTDHVDEEPVFEHRASHRYHDRSLLRGPTWISWKR